MKFKLKGQALALVLIVVVLAVIVVLAVTSRVANDIREQSLERASTRAETIAESAVDAMTQKILKGEINLATTTSVTYGIASDQNPTQTTVVDTLGLCQTNATDITKKCDRESVVKTTVYSKIIRFKLANSENLEVHLCTVGGTCTSTGAASSMSLSVAPNTTYSASTAQKSAIEVKAYVKDPAAGTYQNRTRLVAECVWDLVGQTGSCIPNTINITSAPSTEPCRTDLTTYGTAGTSQCVHVQPASTSTYVSFYRIKALLTPNGSTTPYIEVSATSGTPGSSGNFDFPVPQMAFIRAGVYAGEQQNGQGIFQEANRLLLIRPIVPEVADYVLFNGSDQPIKK